jgi:DNA-directed RNA polymerase specialized sigma24 family protein
MGLPPFQYLLDEYGRDVHRMLIASVGPVDADDCYQETWIAALRAYPRLRDASNLRAWVLTVAQRKAIDHMRKRSRTAIPAGDAVEVGDGAALTGSGLVAAGGTATAAATFADGPEFESPWPSVRRLPPKQRMAIALRFVLDLDFEAVGAAMGTSADAARRNVHEGLKKLREEYTDDRS